MYIHPVDFYPDRQFKVDPTACFVIMPFSETWSPRTYEVLKDCVEGAGYVCRRGDDYYGRIVLVDVCCRDVRHYRARQIHVQVAQLLSSEPPL